MMTRHNRISKVTVVLVLVTFLNSTLLQSLYAQQVDPPKPIESPKMQSPQPAQQSNNNNQARPTVQNPGAAQSVHNYSGGGVATNTGNGWQYSPSQGAPATHSSLP